MNAKQVFSAIAIAFAGTTAFAYEGTEHLVVPPSTLTREEVKAELLAAQKEGKLNFNSEVGSYADQPVTSSRSREEVREEARIAAREHKFNNA